MNRFAFRSIAGFILSLLLTMLACSSSTGVPASSGSGYRYDGLPEEGHNDAAISEYRTISQWDKFELTYFFLNDTDKLAGDRERELVRQAFGLWAAQTPLQFSEVSDGSRADIVIGWASGEHGDGDPFDGPGDVLAHASFPNPYDERQVFLHFDDDERWVDSDTGDIDLLTVAAHEIGHTLGLEHTNDPNALMFPSYSGPHRFLGQDDIAGAQSLYGLASEPPERPEVPPDNETPPTSGEQDSDGDGISDSDEILRTGTDPENPDSDRDGLSDGVEVLNRMNPLDPDMDHDGVNDGQEVADGSNPFFPDQSTTVSPELASEVSDFLKNAIALEISAYRNGDASLAASSLAGDVFEALEDNIASLNRQGLVQISEIDYYQSFINDIRVINNAHLEVDTCEVWSNAAYRLSDGELVSSDGPTLIPQTITIQKLDAGWFITGVQFFDSPAFCQ